MPETFEFDKKLWERTGEFRLPKCGDFYWSERTRKVYKAKSDFPAYCDFMDIVREVPAPPAVQGEPGEAVRELAARIYSAIGAETEKMASEKTYWKYTPPDEATKARMLAVIESELAREPKP